MNKFDFQCVADKLSFDEVYDNKLKQVREVLSENDLTGVLNTEGYATERHYENLSRENELFKKANSENKTRFTCTCCKKNLTLNHTKERLYYFQHEHKTYATDCRYYSYEYVENKENNSIYERESREHKFAKRFIQQWFASAGINLTSERRIKNALNRPDLQGMMNNKNIVIEIQRSNINRKKIIQRMDEYSSNFNEYYQLWCIIPPNSDKQLIKAISELKHKDTINFNSKFKSLSERRLVYYQNKIGFILDLGLELNIDKIRLLAIQYFEEQSELKGRIFEVNSPIELFCYDYFDYEYNSKNLLLTSEYIFYLNQFIQESNQLDNIFIQFYKEIKNELQESLWKINCAKEIEDNYIKQEIKKLEEFNKVKVIKIDIYTQLNNNSIQIKTIVHRVHQGKEEYIIDPRFTGDDFKMVIPHNFHKSFVSNFDTYLGILKDKNIDAPVNIYSNQNILINCFNSFYKSINNKKYDINCNEVAIYKCFVYKTTYLINMSECKGKNLSIESVLGLFFYNRIDVYYLLQYLLKSNSFNNGYYNGFFEDSFNSTTLEEYFTSHTCHFDWDKMEYLYSDNVKIDELIVYLDIHNDFILTRSLKFNPKYNSNYYQFTLTIDDNFRNKMKPIFYNYLHMNLIRHNNKYLYFKNFEHFMIEKTGSIQVNQVSKEQLNSIFSENIVT